MGGGGNTIPETPQEKAQGDIANKQYSDYQKRWSPVISFYKNRLDQGQGAQRGLLQGQGATDLQGRFGAAKTQLDTGLRSHGIETGSGKDLFANNTMSTDLASALGGNRSMANSSVDQYYTSGLQKIIGIGRGQRSSADSSLASLSGLSGSVAAENAEAAGQEASGLGQVAGLGAGAAAAYGLQPYGSQNPPASSQPINYGINT